jgi:branched-chain amino acid transport system ATP-binding protein
MLEIEKICFSYAGVPAITDVSLAVKAGEIVALIGANGAGKTTTLRCISGLLPLGSGTIRFDGNDISAKPSHFISRAGIAHVLEGRHLFKHLTVRENLELGLDAKAPDAPMRHSLEDIFGLFPRIRERQDQKAGTLSGGEQQMVAMARALLGQPKLMLLDEPSMGLAPTVVDTIFDVISEVVRSGLPILLVEQNANRALELADRAYVLEVGRIAMSGTGQELLGHDDVRRSYLGR